MLVAVDSQCLDWLINPCFVLISPVCFSDLHLTLLQPLERHDCFSSFPGPCPFNRHMTLSLLYQLRLSEHLVVVLLLCVIYLFIFYKIWVFAEFWWDHFELLCCCYERKDPIQTHLTAWLSDMPMGPFHSDILVINGQGDLSELGGRMTTGQLGSIIKILSSWKLNSASS